ncbi:MAG: hypothetical protein Tsb0020_52570 [Haliangiales bacterium]
MEPDEPTLIRGPTIWHPPFYELISERAPPTTEVRTEIELSKRSQRADLLLLRRKGSTPRDHEAGVLRGLWPRLSRVALAEFKGPSAGFRRGDLLTLFGYGVQYHRHALMDTVAHTSDLTLVLITPAETQPLRAAVERLRGCRLEHLGGGYARIVGAWYDIIVAFTDAVCEAERDDYLRLFSRLRAQNRDALQWMNKYYKRITKMGQAHELEGYDEMTERLLEAFTPEQRMRGLTLEQRLASVSSEELAGLSPEERAIMRKLLDQAKSR